MKKSVVFIFIIITSIPLHAFYREDVEPTIRKVADYIIEETSFRIEKGEPKSKYNNWEYENGVLNIGMLRLGEVLDDKKYIDFAVRNYDFAMEHSKLLDIYDINNLDACGALGAGIIDAYKINKNKGYMGFIDSTAVYISEEQVRLEDGTLCRPRPYRMTVWVDDLYMSVPFLARMAELSGDNNYFNDAAKQVIQFTNYLFNKDKGLYYHYWYSDTRKPGVAFWGRGNGWAMMAQTELLSYLPQNHPMRDTLVSILHNFILGASRNQGKTGVWHQLLDKTDSYLETSCTAMFTYSVARAVNEGWIDARYASIAIQGWKGLTTMIQDDGQVESTCVGTGVDESLVHYYTRPRKLNDIHCLGAVILAGAELIEMSGKYFPRQDFDGLNVSIFELPIRVREALKKKYGRELEIFDMDKQIENGEVFYEIEGTYRGEEIEVWFNEKGEIVKQ